MKHVVYLGYDSRYHRSYDIARASILRHSKTAHVIPIELNIAGKLLTRPIERKEDGTIWDPISEAPWSTEFAISRFLVPFLKPSGLALFMDSDIVVTTDIGQLFAIADGRKAAYVVKHEQEVKEGTKMNGQVQSAYPRKNWSSVMLWDLDHVANKQLTLADVNTRPGRDLHALYWLKDDEIGTLPKTWNFLVGHDSKRKTPAVIHFTLGVPSVPGHLTDDYADVWWDEYRRIKPAEADALLKSLSKPPELVKTPD